MAISLHYSSGTSVDTQMCTQSRPIRECTQSVHRALTPCTCTAANLALLKNSTCSGKTQNRKDWWEVWSTDVHQGWALWGRKHFPGILGARDEILAAQGECICCKGGSSHYPTSTLSCLPLPPSASATTGTPPLPKPVWVLTPFTIQHHQPPADHHQNVFLWAHFPHH